MARLQQARGLGLLSLRLQGHGGSARPTQGGLGQGHGEGIAAVSRDRGLGGPEQSTEVVPGPPSGLVQTGQAGGQSWEGLGGSEI